MASLKPSYRRINYSLRPSKQVERRLVVQIADRLRTVGYDISRYRYVGMGSVYYADFVLFHKYLYIDDMLCAESDEIPNAMAFNKPFEFIDLKMQTIGSVAGELEPDRRHLVWLDYDSDLTSAVLDDVRLFTSRLAAGSILLVTVKAHPPARDVEGEDPECAEHRLANLLEDMRSVYSGIAVDEVEKSHLTRRGLAALVARTISTLARSEASARPTPLAFHQFLSCRYADGAQMVTVGGIVDEADRAAAIHEALEPVTLVQLDPEQEPKEVSVPMLTSRERGWLEQNCVSATSKEDVAFEIDQDDLDRFRDFYREYPVYHEIVA